MWSQMNTIRWTTSVTSDDEANHYTPLHQW